MPFRCPAIDNQLSAGYGRQLTTCNRKPRHLPKPNAPVTCCPLNGPKIRFLTAFLARRSRRAASVPTGSSWAKIVSGLSGSNAGAIRVEAAANQGNQRTAIITVTANGNQMTVSLIQAAKAAELEIDPEMQTAGFDGGDLNFSVSKTGYGTISWATAVTTGPAWAHITAGSTGSNEGRITIEIDKNTGAPRTATFTVTTSDPSASPKILTINQDIANGIDMVNATSKLNVYPNPVVNQCTVQIENFDGASKTLEVFNMMGQVESIQTLTQESTLVDLSGLSKGVYVFRISSENRILSQSRVVKD